MGRWGQVSLFVSSHFFKIGLTGRLNDKDKIEKMGIKLKDVMDLAISTVSAMTFSWGYVDLLLES